MKGRKLLCHSNLKFRTVKTDNFCDGVAADCDVMRKVFVVNKIDIHPARSIVQNGNSDDIREQESRPELQPMAHSLRDLN
jgi:hypothetical protein